MAYNEALAARIRRLLEGTKGLEEKKMFGGVGFLVEGNMACGVWVLVAEQGYRSDKALQDRIAASMAFARSLPRK
jgi:TfoX/Sxy family transcriptional regulator of competence genes